MKNFNKINRTAKVIRLTAIIILVFSSVSIFAQDKTKDNTPVSEAFWSGTFLENQTYLMNNAKAVEMIINHRFGKLSDGSKEAWGIYSPSNIRIGFNYSFTKKLQIGIGATKYNKQADGNIKYNIFEQTKSGSKPVSLTYYGNFVYDGRESSAFANPDFKEAHRLSYFHELMIARKIGKHLTLQVAPLLTWYNLVETANPSVATTWPDSVKADPVRKNMNIGLSVLGKVRINYSVSFLFEMENNFTKLVKETATDKNPVPVISFGLEKSTGAHALQLFVSTGEAITYQRNLVYNQNKIGKDGEKKSGLMLGFNMTRLF